MTSAAETGFLQDDGGTQLVTEGTLAVSPMPPGGVQGTLVPLASHRVSWGSGSRCLGASVTCTKEPHLRLCDVLKATGPARGKLLVSGGFAIQPLYLLFFLQEICPLVGLVAKALDFWDNTSGSGRAAGGTFF